MSITTEDALEKIRQMLGLRANVKPWTIYRKVHDRISTGDRVVHTLTARVKALEAALREALDEWRTADEDMHFELVGGKYTEEERLTELRALLTGGTDGPA